MALALVRGHLHVHDEVGGVAGGGQRAVASQRLVRRALVEALSGRHAVLLGLQPHHGEVRVQLLGLGLRQLVLLEVPPRALQKVPRHVAPVLGRRLLARKGLLVLHVEVPHDGVDGDLVLARVVLQSAREERLREEQAADPVHRGRALVDPLVDELDALQQVDDPGRQRLQARVRLAAPHVGHLVVEDAVGDSLQLGRHHHQALERLQALLQALAHDDDQGVVADALLRQHRIHALVVVCGVLVVHLVDVEGGRAALEDVLGGRLDDVLAAEAAAAVDARLQRQHRLEHGVRLVLVARDVRVLVQPEDLRRRHLRQRLDELHEVRLGVAVGADVHAGGRVAVRLGHHPLGDVVEQQVVHQPPVLVVRHAPAVVALAHQVHQRLERHRDVLVGARLVEEHAQLPQGDLQIRVVEPVRDVPAQGSELLALLHKGVEERQAHEQLLELAGAAASLEEVGVVDGVVEEALHHVGAHALGRLVGHLDAVLEHRHGEVLGRVRREPQPERGVGRRLGGVELLADAVQGGHP
mmetsp:Transcript_14881/g.35930  ORF Transcript_14881/g.35930 Transcript_14881/m.35930 type:complete len:525 (+) Transcript_14881:305-1879(+)